MTTEHYCLLLIATVLLATNAFWLFTVWRLTDKLMSRNYFEFVSAENLRTTSKTKTHPEKNFSYDSQGEDLRALEF